MKNLDVAGLVWGLALALAAGLGLWIGTGHQISWLFIQFGVPLALISLGVLGLVLSRRPRHPHES